MSSPPFPNIVGIGVQRFEGFGACLVQMSYIIAR